MKGTKTLALILLSLVTSVSNGQPPARLLDDTLKIELLLSDLPATAMRLDYHRERGLFFIMHRNGDLATFDPVTNVYEQVAAGSAMGIAEPSGFGIAPNGDLFVVGNDRDDPWVTGTLKRAALPESSNTPGTWVTVAQTVPYPLSKDFNHLMSALLVGPKGRWIYINSGSRSDHGEVQDNLGAHPGVREVPITSAILRVPADGVDLIIPNDFDSLQAAGILFADGVRNHFDLAVGPNDHLFGVENSGVRDDAEELNWLREGRHYGFPWRIGGNDTPQQFPDYDPSEDLLINTASQTVSPGLFVNDPTYPPPPDGIEFTDPIPSLGPHAAEYRGPDGVIYNAPNFDGVTVSFTPHKSPLGLVFDTAGVLAEPFTGDGFMLGWNQASSDLLAPFEDPGEDLLHLDLRFDSLDGNYSMRVRRIADSLAMPIDAALVDTSLYVMEMRFFGTARMWRIDFPRKQSEPKSGIPIEHQPELPANRLLSAYPNPVGDEVSIRLATDGRDQARLEMIDVSGRVVLDESHDLAAGEHTIRLETRRRNFAPGLYVIRATIGGSTSNLVVTLIR